MKKLDSRLVSSRLVSSRLVSSRLVSSLVISAPSAFLIISCNNGNKPQAQNNTFASVDKTTFLGGICMRIFDGIFFTSHILTKQ